MEIYVLSGPSTVEGMVEVYLSVIWTLQFFGPGDFELRLPGTSGNVQLLKKGRMLVRAPDIIADGVYKNVMLIENIEIVYDAESGYVMTVSGGSIKRLLYRRIVWAQTNLTGTVETGIRQVITENVISPSNADRTMTGFTLAASHGYLDTFEVQLFGENIGEWMEEACQTYGYGWDVFISAGNFVFDLVRGTDRTYDQADVVPVVFSPQYDNLVESSYRYETAEYSNAALIGGEGEGTSQRTASIGTATGYDRYESYIDGDSVSSNGEIITVEQYTAMLEAYGREQLSQTAFTEQIEGETISDGMYVFNADYFLGDLVQIDTGFVSAKSRIVEMIYAEDEKGSTLLPTFSNWEGN